MGRKSPAGLELKELQVRTYWTSLGLNQTGRPVGVTGNISAANPVIEWLTYKAFDQVGRLPTASLTYRSLLSSLTAG